MSKTISHYGEQALILDTAEVKRTLRRVSAHKVADPWPMVLWECVHQLVQVRTDSFNTSLNHTVVQLCFKTATVIPKEIHNDMSQWLLPCSTHSLFDEVPREISQGSPNIQTSLPTLDPYQFAYYLHSSTGDAISSALHLSLAHLEGKNTQMLFWTLVQHSTRSFLSTWLANWDHWAMHPLV